MKPKVSIIVPIYNMEKYLEKCIDSIVNQTLSNIEIILVNDGATDSSGKIIDKYAKKDNRIKVINKENGGQGAARNEGIDVASGEYIGFVDSDDWIDLDMYEKMYEIAKEEDLDISICSRKIWSEGYELKSTIEVKNELVNNIEKDIPSYIVDYLLYPNTVSACNKIYRLKTIKENNIKFYSVDNVGSEDMFFNYCVLLHIKNARSIYKTYYNGVERSESTTRKYRSGAMKRTANLIEEIYRYSEKVNKLEVASVVAPIMLVFFQQWNYNFIKTYAKKNLTINLINEHREAEKNKYFKKAEKEFIFNTNVKPYIKKMGYSLKGKLFMSLYMGGSLIGAYKITAKIRTIL